MNQFRFLYSNTAKTKIDANANAKNKHNEKLTNLRNEMAAGSSVSSVQQKWKNEETLVNQLRYGAPRSDFEMSSLETCSHGQIATKNYLERFG